MRCRIIAWNRENPKPKNMMSTQWVVWQHELFLTGTEPIFWPLFLCTLTLNLTLTKNCNIKLKIAHLTKNYSFKWIFNIDNWTDNHQLNISMLPKVAHLSKNWPLNQKLKISPIIENFTKNFTFHQKFAIEAKNGHSTKNWTFNQKLKIYCRLLLQKLTFPKKVTVNKH